MRSDTVVQASLGCEVEDAFEGAEMSPIIKLDKMTTPTMVFVGITRNKRSNKCLIMPCDTLTFASSAPESR